MSRIKTREQAVAVIAECLEQQSGEEIARIYTDVVGAAVVYDEKEDRLLCSNIGYLGKEADAFTQEEKIVAAKLINHYGDGQHPVADENNLSAFGRNFLIECLNKGKDAVEVTPSGQKVIKGLIEKMKTG